MENTPPIPITSIELIQEAISEGDESVDLLIDVQTRSVEIVRHIHDKLVFCN